VVYGSNGIVVPNYAVWILMLMELLKPFYLFELISVVLWFVDGYNYYASTILIIAGYSFFMEVFEAYKVSEFMTEVPISVHVLV
jgi:cation-transporting ATPase 13A3/4/5